MVAASYNSRWYTKRSKTGVRVKMLIWKMGGAEGEAVEEEAVEGGEEEGVGRLLLPQAEAQLDLYH